MITTGTRGDVKLDEDLIDDLLAQTPSPKNAFEIQQGILMLLVDAFDRKVSRKYFLSFTSQALTAYATVGRLVMIHSIDDNFKRQTLDQEAIDHAYNGLISNATTDLCSLRQVLDAVRQCPTSEDKVH